jgi:membrane fusion protein (multidrug efflux system)
VGAVILLVVLVVILFNTRSGNAKTDARRTVAAIVQVEVPRRDTVFDRRQYTGDVVAIQQAAIFSKVSGNLERVYADIGTRVRRNQVLALIDTTELYQQYQQASATYINALSTDQRSKELFEQSLVAKQDRDNADAAMKVAKAAFELARTHLDYARITAPFAGYVTKRYLDPGALVNPNSTTLFTLMDLDAMKIIVNVLEQDIPAVALGKKALVTVDAYPGKVFAGAVSRYAEAVDLSTRTMAVEIDIPNPGHELKPGMFANVTLQLSQHPNALTVPTQAILKDESGYYVYVDRGDVAHRIAVTPGIEQRNRMEVVKGLRGDESVITVGQSFLKDGAAISVQQ